MTQEDKDLLLRDLCARLPYGVICKTSKGNGHLCFINQTIFGIEYGINIKATERDYFNDKEEIIKPYLRPMSSMTEEEKNELKEYLDAEEVDCNGFGYSEGGTLEDYISSIPYSICDGVVNWLNKKMFDFRGLIDKGLAIEVTEELYIEIRKHLFDNLPSNTCSR